MNKKQKARINAVADIIAETPHVHTWSSEDNLCGFNMAGYTHLCGTPSCIAGWAAYLSVEKIWKII